MILTRSPFYFNVEFANDFVTKATFGVSIQYLDSDDVIQAKTQTLDKFKPSDEATNTWLDISPFVNDFYSHKPIDTSLYNTPICIESRDVLAVAVSSSQIDSLGSDLPSTMTFLDCLDGYGYYGEGQNAAVKRNILLSHNNYKAYENGYFIVPLSCDDNSENPEVNGVEVPLSFVNNTQNLVKYLVIPLGAYTGNVSVEYGGEVINIELIEECKYPVSEIQFINKNGVIEQVHFYKAIKETISTKSETFKNAYTNGVSYDIQRHQIKDFNKVSNKSVKIETGYLNPEYNQTLQELMESEYVWLDGKPVNISSRSLEFKTRIVDKLISYSLQFSYAYDEINNV